MRNWKTTLLGLLALIAGGVTIWLVAIEKATLTEAGGYLVLLLTFIVGIKGLVEKDHDSDKSADTINPDPKPPRPKTTSTINPDPKPPRPKL